ncbi:MAG TPA: DUF2188 domain-containing protein [Pyrinomonadaceae bacterium]|jgi:hypothetical protein
MSNMPTKSHILLYTTSHTKEPRFTATPMAEARKVGRESSRNQHTEFVIHGKYGVIQRSDSHGGDPNPPKDKR